MNSSKRTFWWTAGVLSLLWILLYVALAFGIAGLGASGLQGKIDAAIQEEYFWKMLLMPFSHFLSMFDLRDDVFEDVFALAFWTGLLGAIGASLIVRSIAGVFRKRRT